MDKQLLNSDYNVLNDLASLCTNKDFCISHFAVIVCESGSCSIETEDHGIFTISSYDFLFLYPQNNIHIGKCSFDFKGFCIAISASLGEEIIFAHFPNFINIFLFTPGIFHFSLNKVEYDLMLSYSVFITNNLDFDQDLSIKSKKLFHISISFFLDIYSLFSERNIKNSRGNDHKNSIVASFLKNLKLYHHKERSLTFYASEKLFITPKYLSSVIKEVTGLTARYWIATFVVSDAKKKLRNCSKTVQEVSSDLNFPNQSCFGKYFKTYEGISPLQFRNELVNK